MDKKMTAILVVVVAAVLLAAVALTGISLNNKSQASSGVPILQTAQENGNFTKFVNALNTTGLTDTLNGSGPYTVFAPTDTAFAAMNQTQLNALTMDKNNLTMALKYHVVPGKFLESQLSNNMTLKTLEGGNLVIIENQTGTYVNGAKVTMTGIQGSNGVIYAIDKVLIPQTLVQALQNNTNLTKLTAAVMKANLTATLNGSGPFTVFAPNDAAFASANQTYLNQLMSTNDTANLTKLLTYHVVPGLVIIGNGTNSTLLKTVEGSDLLLIVNSSGVYVNNAKVVMQNIVTTNGVIQVIDKVLVPPKTIIETAIADGNFTKLVSAINAANLTSTLNGTGPFTVFAPTDAAFSKLDQTLLNRLETSDRANLTKLLTYHVVSGMEPSFALKNGTVTTLEGEKLNVTVNGSNVTIGNVTVTMTDIVTSNGIIHVINQVLVPPSLSNLSTAVSSATGNMSLPSTPVANGNTQPAASTSSGSTCAG